jgi:WD40 repeat protein
MNQLPEEIVAYLLSFLDDAHLKKSGSVCKKWLRLSRDDLIWKYLCVKRYGQNLSNDTLRKSNSWKYLYYNKTIIENENWAYDKIKPSMVMANEFEAITCLQFDDRWIVAGGGIHDETFDLSSLFVDKSIRVWNVQTGELLHTLYGHLESVNDVKFEGNTIVSCSRDRRIKVWNVPDEPELEFNDEFQEERNNYLVKSWKGHSKSIYSLYYGKGIIVSGSKDQTVRIWSPHGKHHRTLTGHTKDVFTVASDGDTIISGGLDKTMKIWDTERGVCKQTIVAHKGWVSAVKFDDKYIVTGGDKYIKIWDMKTGQLIRTLKGHTGHFPPGWITTLQFDDNKIISGSFDRSVKIWDFNYGNCINTLSAHKDKVTALQFDNEKLITGAKDRTVKVWDFSSVPSLKNSKDNKKCTIM